MVRIFLSIPQEIQRLEADLKSVEREMEIVTMKKPNVLEVEKQLSLKKQE